MPILTQYPNWWGVNTNAVNSGEQLNNNTLSGTVLTFEDTVEKFETLSGTIMSFADTVIGTIGGTILTLADTVVGTATSLDTRRGWNIAIYLNNVPVPNSILRDELEITFEENVSSTATFTILNNSNTAGLAPIAIQGGGSNWNAYPFTMFMYKPLRIDCWTPTNGWYRCFTGIITNVSIALNYGAYTIVATDNRENILRTYFNNNLNSLRSIGRYVPPVDSTDADVLSELSDRLSTIPYSMQISPYGTPQLTPMLRQAEYASNMTVSKSVTTGMLRHETFVLNYGDLASVTTKVNIKAQYRYSKLYQAVCTFSWTPPFYRNGSINMGKFLQGGYTVPTKDMIQNAAASNDWVLAGDVTFVQPPANGVYNVNGVYVAYSTISNVQIETNDDTTSGGNQNAQVKSYEDVRGVLAFGASWTAYHRWSQSITENYLYTITSTFLNDMEFGRTETINVAVISDFDTEAWDDNSAARGVPSGLGQPKYGNDQSYYYNMDTKWTTWTESIIVAQMKAHNMIQMSSRNSTISYSVPLDPTYSLMNEVSISYSNARVEIGLAKENLTIGGKVTSYKHVFQFGDKGIARTDVVLSFIACMFNGGNQATATLPTPQIPTRPVLPDRVLSYAMSLPSYYGVDPTNLNLYGYVGNKVLSTRQNTNWGTGINYSTTQYATSFTIKSPVLPSSYTDSININTTVNYSINPAYSLTEPTLTIEPI